MTTINNSLAIAWKELQVMLKDRGLLAVLFVLPLLFASMFSLSQQGAVDEATGAVSITIDVYAVNEDEGPFGGQVVDVLSQLDMLDVVRLDSAAEADQLVGEGERSAAIVIPADFSEKINGYQQTTVDVVVDPVQQQVAGLVTGLSNFAVSPVVIQGELQHGIRNFLDQAGILDDAPPEAVRAIEAQIMGTIMTQLQDLDTDPPIKVTNEGVSEENKQEPINLFDIMMPAFSVMFAFFLTGHIGQTFHKERDEGTFRRLLASPLSKLSLIGGPGLAYAALIILQVMFLFGIAAGLFGMELGDSPFGLLLVTLALGTVVAGLGLLLGALTRTGKQADTLGTLLAFVLPFVSGIFVMGGLTPGYLQEGFIGTLAPFLPHMHAAEGFRLIMTGEGTAGQVLSQVGFLLIFAVVFFGLARWRLKFE